jgi:hypothetical protein
MSLVAGLLRPRLFSSKLSKLKATEKYSGSATPVNYFTRTNFSTGAEEYGGGVGRGEEAGAGALLNHVSALQGSSFHRGNVVRLVLNFLLAVCGFGFYL